MGTEKVIEVINYFFDVWALRPNYAMEQAKEYLAAYTEEQVSEAVKAERERHIERLNDMMGIGNICNERVFDYIKELEEVTK